MDPTRRDLLSDAGRWVLTASTTVVAGFGVRAARAPAGSMRPIVHLANVTSPVETDEIIVLPAAGGTVRAFSTRCPHLGCRVSREGEAFACPCHGSRFDSNGRRVAGPATTGLERIPVQRAANGEFDIG